MSTSKRNHCTFNYGMSLYKEVWKEVEIMIGIRNSYEGEDIEEAFGSWYVKKDINKAISLPLNIVWLARNLKLFEGKEALPLICVV
jgi:hypothetical protein